MPVPVPAADPAADLDADLDAGRDVEGNVDPRGARFAAAVTSVVLVATLLTGSAWLAAGQAVVFALGAFAGVRWSPWSVLFRVAVAPRLGPPAVREPAAPVRFSQLLGLVLTLVAVGGLASGLTVVGLVATALALAAASLNAVFDVCLACLLFPRLPVAMRRALTFA